MDETLTKLDLEEAAMDLANGLPFSLLSSIDIQKLMTIGQYVTDLGLAELERRGEVEFHAGEPVLPYLSDHMVETLLTRPLLAN